MEDIKEAIRQHLLNGPLKGESSANLRDDTPLQSSGILDSLAVLGLITFLEKKFSVELSASETGIEGFDRITEMAALVAKKRSA